ncbi:hypothetical protein HZB04_04065 [Candidatus Wolfebacteria bacterium]|nr:hypothetical protein [Candidatus Wolfebacteria bacterium]
MKKILTLVIISFIFSGCATYPVGSNKWWSVKLGEGVIRVDNDYSDGDSPRVRVTTIKKTIIF